MKQVHAKHLLVITYVSGREEKVWADNIADAGKKKREYQKMDTVRSVEVVPWG